MKSFFLFSFISLGYFAQSTSKTTPTPTTAPTTTTLAITTTETTNFGCECRLRSLKELESLEKSWRRLRVENTHGLTKYPTNNDSLAVGCQTLAVYENTVYSGTYFPLTPF